MATMATKLDIETTSPVAMRPVGAPATVCGDCRYHIPHATRPSGWCACDAAELRWKPVAAAGAACGDFTT
jgi:hypothetical protein